MTKITYKIPGNSSFVMTEDLTIIDASVGELLPVVNDKVSIALYGRIVNVNVNWLWLFSLYKLELETGYEQHVNKIVFKPYDLKSHGIKLDHIPVFKEPVSYIHDSDYRLLALYPSLAISKDGRMVNVVTGLDHSVTRNKNGYTQTNVKDPVDNIYKSVGLHRLVAMAWIPNDDYVAKPIVDHKDGDKTNCHADNLEWVSFTTNNRRACEQGLKTDNLTVKVMDYETNSVTVFGSMTQACEFMGRSRISRLEEFCSVPKLINKRYQIKLGNDMTAWDFKDNKGSYCVTIDGVLKTYVNLKALKAELLPMLPEKAGIDKIIPKLKRVYPDIVIDFPERAKIGRETYQFKCMETGEVFDALTRKEITDRTGLAKSTVAKYLGLGDSYYINGFSLRVKSDEPWSEDVHDDLSSMVSVTLTHSVTGVVQKFNSLRKAAEFLKVDKRVVKTYLESGLPYRNYVIRKY